MCWSMKTNIITNQFNKQVTCKLTLANAQTIVFALIAQIENYKQTLTKATESDEIEFLLIEIEKTSKLIKQLQSDSEFTWITIE